MYLSYGNLIVHYNMLLMFITVEENNHSTGFLAEQVGAVIS